MLAVLLISPCYRRLLRPGLQKWGALQGLLLLCGTHTPQPGVIVSGPGSNPSLAPSHPGCALNDSPVGLAAYILEKFSTWTKSEYRDLEDGGLER